jgi:hypothetical protein
MQSREVDARPAGVAVNDGRFPKVFAEHKVRFEEFSM